MTKNKNLYILNANKITRKIPLGSKIMVFFILIFMNFYALFVSGQVQPIEQVQEKLEGIFDLEATVLESLFSLSQHIEEMERQEVQIISEKETLQAELEVLEQALEEKQNHYVHQLDILRTILTSYQKSGPGSYLETLLGSKDLTSFLRSLNVIKAISRNSSELLSSIEKDKYQLAAERQIMSEKFTQLEDTEAALQAALKKTLQLKEEQEDILRSLAGEREIYQDELENLRQMWDEIKVLFSDILIHFTSIIEQGEFPVESLNLRLSFPRITGSIYDEVLNDILANQPDIPQMIFHFYPDQIVIDVPDKYLTLIGKFSIDEDSMIKFEVDEGSFYGLPLEKSSIEELFRNGSLYIDSKALVGNINLESVEFYEGYLDFVLVPVF